MDHDEPETNGARSSSCSKVPEPRTVELEGQSNKFRSARKRAYYRDLRIANSERMKKAKADQ